MGVAGREVRPFLAHAEWNSFRAGGSDCSISGKHLAALEEARDCMQQRKKTACQRGEWTRCSSFLLFRNS